MNLEDNISCDGAAPQPVVLSEEDASSSGESTEAVAKNPGARLPTIHLSSPAFRLNKIQEWFLPSNFSQSTLDGRFGSNACVVIALEVVQTFLSRDMALPQAGQQPPLELVHGFIGAMRNGCEHYESVPGLAFLSVDRALALWPGLKLGIANHGDFAFFNEKHVKDWLPKEMARRCANKSSIPYAAVFVQTPYSVCVVVQQGVVGILDSHSHGSLGGLIALSGPSATSADVVAYLAKFHGQALPTAVLFEWLPLVLH